MKTLDFDKFRSEQTDERIEVTVYGKRYTVPCAVPAIVPVLMARAAERNDKTDNTRLIIKAAEALFGEKAIDELCKLGISAKELAELVQQIFSVVNGEDEDEEETVDDESGMKKVGKKKSEKK